MSETVSLVGTQVTALALPLTAVMMLHVSSPQLGLLRFGQFVPFLLFGLAFGFLADRRRRVPLMVAANAVRAGLIGAVPLLAVFHVLDLGMLYAIVFVVGALTVLFDVCWMSVLPDLVADADLLVEANSKVGASYSAAEIAGPGLAGVLVQALTAPVALVVDSCSYVTATTGLLRLRVTEPTPRAAAGTQRRLVRELSQGFRLIVTNPYLRIIAILGAAFNFFFLFTEPIFILYAVRTLRFSGALIGIVLSAGAAGGLVGTVIAPLLTRRLPLGAVYTVAIVIGFTGLLLIPAAAGSKAMIVAMFCAGFFVTSTGIGAANVVSISLRQRVTPPSMMGRMTAAMRMVMYGVGALGALASGFVAASVGLRGALLVAAVGSSCSVLPLLCSSLPRLRALPPAAEDA